MQRLKPSLQNSFKKKLKSAKIRITNLLITNPQVFNNSYKLFDGKVQDLKHTSHISSLTST